MDIIEKLRQNLNSVIIGKSEVIDKIIVGLISEGHMLIEDVPGTGKTTLAKAVALSFAAKFKRIQFTPDLLPTDITGITIYDMEKRDFKVRLGPIFANILLADEINRGTPKTQSALLEAMAEYRVTIDGVDYGVEKPFIVIATENPIEYEGTFPLPEAQLDRFIMRFSIGYPDKGFEKEMLFLEKIDKPLEKIVQIGSLPDILEAQNKVKQIYVHSVIAEYIVDLANYSRNHKDFYLGVSPRGSIFLMRIAQAWAFLDRREFVLPDDVKKSVVDVFNHRVMMKAEAKLRGIKIEDVLNEIIESIPVPKGVDFSK